MHENYSYPLDEDWNNNEIITVMALYNAVESAYEHGIKRETFLDKYRSFQRVVPMKMEQKRLDHEFETESGYSIYKVFKQSKTTPENGKVRVRYEDRH